MIKKLKYDGLELTVNTNMSWMRKYKSQFGKDPSKILMPAIKASMDDKGNVDSYTVMEELGFVGMQDIAWAACSNPGEDPDEWIERIGEKISVIEVVQDIIALVIESSFSSKNSPAPQPAKKKVAEKK